MDIRTLLPPGYEFRPTDGELVSYLYNKVVPEARGVCDDFHSGVIYQFDVYGAQEPWDMWNMFQDCVWRSGYNEDLYLFTKLKKTTSRGSRSSRKVGSGKWKGMNRAEQVFSDDVFDGSAVVGLKKRFQYQRDGQQQGDQHVYEGASWIMFEYSLADYPTTTTTTSSGDYVLCQLRKKSILDRHHVDLDHDRPEVNSNSGKRKLCSAEDDGDHQEVVSVMSVADEQYYERQQKQVRHCMPDTNAAIAHVGLDQVQQQQQQQQRDDGVDPEMTPLSDDELVALGDFLNNLEDDGGGSGRQDDIFADLDPLPLRPPPTISAVEYEQQNLIDRVLNDHDHLRLQEEQLGFDVLQQHYPEMTGFSGL